MKRFHVIMAAIVLLALAAGMVMAKVEVVKIVFCRQVAAREPVEPGETFPADVGWVYCHTTVQNTSEPTEIHHDWFYEGAYISRYTLQVGTAAGWRTYSAKQMSPAWQGKWEVVVRSQGERELGRKSFTVVEVED